MKNDAVTAFLEWSELDRGRSQHTIARYRAVLSQIEGPINATREEIEAWWATRYTAAPATRSNELACLRAFYKWATRFDLRDDDPTRRLDPPRINHTVPRPIGQADLDRLLGPLTAETPDLRRAIALGAYAGLRVSEAAGLEWSMIDQQARRLYIRGKGSKERVMGLSPLLMDKLLPEVTGNIVTAGGRPYSAAVLQRKVNRLMERHGIAHTFHDLRKRGATMALARTSNPVAVAQAFGWSSIQTATAYAVVGDETLDEISQAMV